MTATIAYFVTQLPTHHLKESLPTPPLPNSFCPESTPTSNQPTYWIYGAGGEAQWLHVNKVLKRLGFRRVPENESDSADLLWAHDYPFTKIKPKVLAMKPHQKINHFPGCGFITNKVDLATTKLKAIPSAFKLPKDKEEFMEFASKNPEKKFVVKTTSTDI